MDIKINKISLVLAIFACTDLYAAQPDATPPAPERVHSQEEVMANTLGILGYPKPDQQPGSWEKLRNDLYQGGTYAREYLTYPALAFSGYSLARGLSDALGYKSNIFNNTGLVMALGAAALYGVYTGGRNAETFLEAEQNKVGFEQLATEHAAHLTLYGTAERLKQQIHQQNADLALLNQRLTLVEPALKEHQTRLDRIVLDIIKIRFDEVSRAIQRDSNEIAALVLNINNIHRADYSNEVKRSMIELLRASFEEKRRYLVAAPSPLPNLDNVSEDVQQEILEIYQAIDAIVGRRLQIIQTAQDLFQQSLREII